MRYFVYGTLKEGYGNNAVFGGAAVLLGQASTKEMYTMISLGGFPGVVLGRRTSNINGEVWEVKDEDKETQRRLDRLEGYPSFYDKKEVETTEGSAWMYFLPDSYLSRDVHEIRVDGNW